MRRSVYSGLLWAGILLVAGGGRAQEPTWVISHTWAAEGTMQTEIFEVAGEAWRVVHKHSGAGLFQVTVHDADGRSLDTVVNSQAPGAGTATLEGRGNRYLEITGLDTQWEVTIEQYLTVIERLNLTQRMRQPAPVLRKIGEWTHDGPADEEYEFTVPKGSWKILHSNSGRGSLDVLVQDEEGNPSLAANTTAAGQGVCWVHRPGRYYLRIRSADTSWRVQVLCQ